MYAAAYEINMEFLGYFYKNSLYLAPNRIRDIGKLLKVKQNKNICQLTIWFHPV